MFDRYESGERAVLVHTNFTQDGEWEDLSECEMLVKFFRGKQLKKWVVERKQLSRFEE